MSKFEKEQVFTYPNVLIAGYGQIGKVLKGEFPFAETYDPDLDQKADYYTSPSKKYDYCFICVPTPNYENGRCNTTYVEQVLEQVDADIYIIRSTVTPGTTDYLINHYHKQIAFSPEYEGVTQHVTKKNWVAIGTRYVDTYHKIRQLYELVHNGFFEFVRTNEKEAEMAKYMENCFLAMKVVFCNEFARLCKKEGILYENARDIFVKDDRIGPSHTFVYDDYPGYDSKCFNKDLPAIASFARQRRVPLFLVEETIASNEQLRSK